MSIFLLADVGGTNVRFALYQKEEITASSTYKIRHFDSFESAVRSFLAQANTGVDGFIIGAAGIKKNNAIQLTNYRWIIDAFALKTTFHLKEVILVNDFSLQGLGLIDCEVADYVMLGKAPLPQNGTRAVIGAGTGLGVCFLVPEKENVWRVFESEGGHTLIGSISKGMSAVNQALAEKIGYVSFERVISGPGLLSLYRLLKEKGQNWVNENLNEEIQNMQSAFAFAFQNQPTGEETDGTEPADITNLAHQGFQNALLCWWLFLKYLAVFCGDMAVTFKTTGGIYLVGNLLSDAFVRKLIERFPFRENFEHKGVLSAYLKQIPVCLTVKKDIPLAGLKYIAHHLNNW